MSTATIAFPDGDDNETPLGHDRSEPQVVRAQGPNFRTGQDVHDTQAFFAGAEQVSAGANGDPAPKPSSPLLVSPVLAFVAQALDDVEGLRMATANRIRIATLIDADDDGVIRGLGVPDDHPIIVALVASLDAFKVQERGLTLALKRELRLSPLHPWIKAQIGLGEKQVARLLSSIGDPYWNTLHERPRTVSELWAYSGLHVIPGQVHGDTHTSSAGEQSSSTGHGADDALGTFAGTAARRRKGQRANWSTDAKTRAYLCAESCVKQARSPYRAVYLDRREHTATTHPEWTKGHSHNDAMRIASKAILRDLWRESKRIHEGDA